MAKNAKQLPDQVFNAAGHNSINMTAILLAGHWSPSTTGWLGCYAQNRYKMQHGMAGSAGSSERAPWTASFWMKMALLRAGHTGQKPEAELTSRSRSRPSGRRHKHEHKQRHTLRRCKSPGEHTHIHVDMHIYTNAQIQIHIHIHLHIHIHVHT